MNNEEARKILQRDLNILVENKSLPDTIESLKVAIGSMEVLEQFKWERDIALQQLEEIGVCLGRKMDGKYLSKEEYEELLKYKYMYEALCR